MGIHTQHRDVAARAAREAAQLLEQHEIFLLFEGTETCGAVPVEPEEVGLRALDLVRPDEGPVCISSADATVGLWMYSDDVAGHGPERWTLLGWSFVEPPSDEH